MSRKMITTELYSHLLIETVCNSKDLLSTNISFITSYVQGTYSAFGSCSFNFWETALQHESN